MLNLPIKMILIVGKRKFIRFIILLLHLLKVLFNNQQIQDFQQQAVKIDLVLNLQAIIVAIQKEVVIIIKMIGMVGEQAPKILKEVERVNQHQRVKVRPKRKVKGIHNQ